MRTGLKRAEQAQPSSRPTAATVIPVSGRKRTLWLEVAFSVQSFRRHFRGPGNKESMGVGAGSGGAVQGGCGPRTPVPGDPAGLLLRCPARQAAPIRPRAISVGRRAGIRAAPPAPALGETPRTDCQRSADTRQNASSALACPEPCAKTLAATHRRRVLGGVCTGCRRRCGPGGRPRLVPACAARAPARPVRLGMPRAEGRARRGRARQRGGRLTQG